MSKLFNKIIINIKVKYIMYHLHEEIQLYVISKQYSFFFLHNFD